MDKLTAGYGLIEGPVWDPDRGLVFSDVTFGGVYAVTDRGEVTTVFEHRRGIGGMARLERLPENPNRDATYSQISWRSDSSPGCGWR